jgi:hypothetical protein
MRARRFNGRYLRTGDVEHVAYRLIAELEADRVWQLVRALERRLEQHGHPRPRAASLVAP